MDINKFSAKPDSTKGTRVSNKRTICEVHRELYDVLVIELASTNPELVKRIVPLLEEAFDMGISLVRRLLKYKCSLPNWERNMNKEELIHIRKLRQEIEIKLRK